MTAERISGLRLISLCLVTALALASYGLTIAPGLTWAHGGADGGDLAVAVHTRGIPHPTGYPTYVLLGMAFARLPFGDLATRLNAMSAVFGALGAGLAAWAAHTLSTYLFPSARWRLVAASVTAGLALASGPILWSQAVITEVYTTALFFQALIMALALATLGGRVVASTCAKPPASVASGARATNAGRYALLGLIGGLGLGAHLSVGFALIAAVGLLASGRERGDWRMWLTTVAGLLAGLGVYGYLPLRAGTSFYSNWGDPRTLARVWWVVSGAAYHEYFRFGLPLSQIGHWIVTLSRQISLPGVAAAALGFWAVWDARRGVALAGLAGLAADVLYTVNYHAEDTLPYYLFSYLVAAVWMGVGLAWVLDWVGRRASERVTNVLAVALAGLIILPSVALTYPQVDLDDASAAEYGREVVEALPPGAVVLSADDRYTFALWYALAVTHPRPDVVSLDVRMLRWEWARENVARFHPELGLDPSRDPTRRGHLLATLAAQIPPEYPIFVAYQAVPPPGAQLIEVIPGKLWWLKRANGS